MAKKNKNITKQEKRKYRHTIARFEGTLHKNVDVISAEDMGNGKKKVVAKIKCFKYAYIFQGIGITQSWRIIE